MTQDKIVKITLTCILIAFFALLVFNGFAPYGRKVSYRYSLQRDPDIISELTGLKPFSEIGQGEGAQYRVSYARVESDETVFKLKVPASHYKKAQVKINFSSDEEMKLGVRNFSDAIYNFLPVFNPILESLKWTKVTDEKESLYQKEADYSAVDEFYTSPPESSRLEPKIATYERSFQPSVDYGDDAGTTEIKNSLRGTHNFYVYVKDGNLGVSLEKQDLDWIEGEDVLKISVYKNEKKVYQDSIGDGKQLSDDSAEIQSRSVELTGLEPGVYKVELSCDNDVLIRKIVVNKRLVVFKSLFLVDNKLIYPAAEQLGQTVFTNSTKVSFSTWHEPSLQEIKVNDYLVKLDRLVAEKKITLNRELSEIYTEKSDLLISGNSYFSISKESFFDPERYSTVLFDGTNFPPNAEYLITSYKSPQKLGENYESNLEFEISAANYKDGIVEFKIVAPGLYKKQKFIIINSIEVSLE